MTTREDSLSAQLLGISKRLRDDVPEAALPVVNDAVIQLRILGESLVRSPIGEPTSDQVEAAVMSLVPGKPNFPSVCLSRSGGIDEWRGIMRAALSASLRSTPEPTEGMVEALTPGALQAYCDAISDDGGTTTAMRAALRFALRASVAGGSNPLAEFAKWVINEGPFSGDDLDGASIQTQAQRLGLIVATKYDPAIHGQSDYAEPGSDWFVFANWLLAGAGGWKDISTAPRDKPNWLFTPASKLGPNEQDDVRLAQPRHWTWATMWMPAQIPAPPSIEKIGGEK